LGSYPGHPVNPDHPGSDNQAEYLGLVRDYPSRSVMFWDTYPGHPVNPDYPGSDNIGREIGISARLSILAYNVLGELS